MICAIQLLLTLLIGGTGESGGFRTECSPCTYLGAVSFVDIPLVKVSSLGIIGSFDVVSGLGQDERGKSPINRLQPPARIAR